MKTLDVLVEPVLRLYLPADGVRPYIEGFGGFAYTDGELEVAAGPVDFHGSGFTLGGGEGLLFELTPSTTLSLGVEYRRSMIDFQWNLAALEGDTDNTDVLGVVMVGVHW